MTANPRVKAPPGLVVYDDPEKLANKLTGAAIHCREPHLVPLTCLATAVILLGAPRGTQRLLAEHMAQAADVLAKMQAFWRMEIAHFPYLEPVLPALTGWMDSATDQEADAARACWAVLARMDLYETVNRPQFGGDILGPVYTHSLTRSVVNARGVFYTPMSVSRMLADMQDVEEGMSVNDPCCGCGGMTVAAVRSMRARQKDPDACTWHLNDVDGVALALAGTNMASHGMHRVQLSCLNALGPEYAGKVFAPVDDADLPVVVEPELAVTVVDVLWGDGSQRAS